MKVGWKLWVLFIALAISLIAIRPSFGDGVIVKSIDQGSPIFLEGLQQGEVIIDINGNIITNKEDYTRVIGEIFVSSGEIRLDVTTKENKYIVLTNQTPQITVENVPKTRIRTGLDLRGGARALVQPDVEITSTQLQDLVAISRNRFNVYGLSDVNIRGVSDLSGNRFMLIEVAGAAPADLEQLISEQGKFEAKIANQTVFEGGERDISDVCRNPSCGAIINSPVASQGGGYSARYSFPIFLKEAAAKRHAEVTENIPLDETGQYLTESLILYVDDQEVDSLLIAASLRGQVTTSVSIQGAGFGDTKDAAVKDARESMKRSQTILLTGSLPYKLKIVKLDTISPTLGKEFVRLISYAIIAAIIAVSIIVFIRYRKTRASLALLLTAFSEIVIILGVAALIRWNLDLPSIAGILATIGTGVDQQIIILDEAGRSKSLSIKERIKRASTIILSAYLTLVAAMIPLYWAGAGLFKGFALTTIIGVTAGILITRPAFAELIRRIEK